MKFSISNMITKGKIENDKEVSRGLWWHGFRMCGVQIQRALRKIYFSTLPMLSIISLLNLCISSVVDSFQNDCQNFLPSLYAYAACHLLQSSLSELFTQQNAVEVTFWVLTRFRSKTILQLLLRSLECLLWGCFYLERSPHCTSEKAVVTTRRDHV